MIKKLMKLVIIIKVVIIILLSSEYDNNNNVFVEKWNGTEKRINNKIKRKETLHFTLKLYLNCPENEHFCFDS